MFDYWELYLAILGGFLFLMAIHLFFQYAYIKFRFSKNPWYSEVFYFRLSRIKKRTINILIILSIILFIISLISLIFGTKIFPGAFALIFFIWVYAGVGQIYKHVKMSYRDKRKKMRKPPSRIKIWEAKRVYRKAIRDYKKNRISKEEVKDILYPYRYELKELGFPLRIQE